MRVTGICHAPFGREKKTKTRNSAIAEIARVTITSVMEVERLTITVTLKLTYLLHNKTPRKTASKKISRFFTTEQDPWLTYVVSIDSSGSPLFTHSSSTDRRTDGKAISIAERLRAFTM